MEEEIITMSGKGQIVIPARVRRNFGLRKGDKLRLEIGDRSIKLILKTVDLTTLVGSIKGIDILALTPIFAERLTTTIEYYLYPNIL